MDNYKGSVCDWGHHMEALAQAIGKALAERRVKAGYTQEQVAEKLGVGNEAVSRMERGTAIPTIIRLFSLCEIYDCSIQQLLFDISPITSDQEQKISALLDGLDHKDRAFILEQLEHTAQHLKRS